MPRSNTRAPRSRWQAKAGRAVERMKGSAFCALPTFLTRYHPRSEILRTTRIGTSTHAALHPVARAAGHSLPCVDAARHAVFGVDTRHRGPPDGARVFHERRRGIRSGAES